MVWTGNQAFDPGCCFGKGRECCCEPERIQCTHNMKVMVVLLFERTFEFALVRVRISSGGRRHPRVLTVLGAIAQ